MEIELAVSQAAKKHGYSPLKNEQRFLSGIAAIIQQLILMTHNDAT